MTEPAWIAAAEAELARLSADLGPMPGKWDAGWWRKRDAQRADFNLTMMKVPGWTGGGVQPLTSGQGFVFRAFGRRATCTSSWEGAVHNAIAAERKARAAG